MSSPSPSRPQAVFPRTHLRVAASATLALVLAMGWLLWNAHSLARTFQERDLQIERACGQITYLDEVLTMSSRMGAATGDLRWEERYLAHVPPLDEAIANAQRLAPGATASQGSAQTDAANQALIALETEAFDLVREGKKEEALALLLSEEYAAHKQVYAGGVDDYLAAMRGEIAKYLGGERKRLMTGLALLAVVTAVLSLAWIFVAGELRRHLEALQEAEQRADRANHAKSAFLANMSHEIRTPLNAICGYAEILTDEEDIDIVHEFAGGIDSSAKHLLEVINAVLDLSKLEAGEVELESYPFNPRELLKDVHTISKQSAEARGLALEVDIAEDIPEVLLGDATRLRQVLINLTGNAIKFTEEGSVRIELSLAEKRLTWAVIDTGPGIAPDKLEHVFGRFSQEDSSVHRTHGGTGIGLSLSRQLAELMGGQLTLESELGQGSLFALDVPMVVDPGPAPASPLPTSEAQRPSTTKI